jgi:hypothetical protein
LLTPPIVMIVIYLFRRTGSLLSSLPPQSHGYVMAPRLLACAAGSDRAPRDLKLQFHCQPASFKVPELLGSVAIPRGPAALFGGTGPFAANGR